MFTGLNCTMTINPCNSQPCFRNGTCLVTGAQSYMCLCPTGYQGTRCEICDCPCSIYPCKARNQSHVYFESNARLLIVLISGVNGGVCRSTATGGVICVCPAGFTGIRWYVLSMGQQWISFFFIYVLVKLLYCPVILIHVRERNLFSCKRLKK